ncbi:RecT family recombinase [Dickeya solani]|uniref:Recombinase RecT n=1 Tax=Dickeya solani TaxID=1089444 RepID=A0ABU4EC04_9GAMM|nr:recombinase RecT [Dickeya solani]MCA6998176.1 recombinase RecT [Dickeya solani]MCA6999529.1 recombinase RecT [Dickeya solani]MDV6995468.1 recombinase RecT [Dickeya solani]MDV7003082.1 recombinase RecT [Dickeya solani]MDV7037948.1 recombinase RecT [Dickeya solani]
MENTSIITTEQQAPSTVSASNAVFNVQALQQLTAFANLMADSRVAVPEHLAGKPADCMAIVMQAMQWGMNPYAVAQKTHLVGGTLGYEAQLVNAVIASSSAIRGRFHYEYDGDWSKCTKTKEISREKIGKNGKYTVTERVRAWTDDDEEGLSIRVGAVLRGETEITWSEPVYLSSVVTRNSPLWVSNPKQQIAYLALKYWSRLYTPDVVLGVYTPDELEHRVEKDITPPQRTSLKEIAAATTAGEPNAVFTAREDAGNIDALADEIRDKIETAADVDQAKAIRSDIEAQKSVLGTALFTELKNKAVKRYYLVDARNRVEAEINSLPQSDESGAAEAFAAVEKTLSTARRHLGDELYEQFATTLLDMRPEYIAD